MSPAVAVQARPSKRETAEGVLVVGPLPPPYHGGAVATQYLLGSALAQPFRLIHLDTTDPRDVSNIGRFDGRNVWLALRHFVGFLRLLQRERPQLVYVPLAQNRLGFLRDCLFLTPALLARRRVVVHVHGGGFGDFHDSTDPLTRSLVRLTMKRVARAIVLGERLRSTLRGLVDDRRIAVVPNGITDPYGGSLPRRPAASSCTVLYLGTLMEAKGFLDVIAAANILAERGTAVRFALAGGWFRASDELAARELHAAGAAQVEFTGAVDAERRAALMQAADIFVLPTRYANEAHPYVLLEAMAAGLPVVTTARGAIPETVEDGMTGIIVPEANVPVLAEAIERLAGDSALRLRMGTAARRRFESEYGVAQWAARLESVLRGALIDA